MPEEAFCSIVGLMLDWISAQEGLAVYLALFFSLMGGAIGLPIPEDIPLLAAGACIKLQSGKPLIIFLVCYGAIVAGDILIFMVGRRFGPTLFEKPWFKKRMPPNRIRRVKFNLEKRSLLMIFLARHLFYLRTLTFLTCGAVKMKVKRFIIADVAAALVSVPLMMGIGYFAAEHFEAAQLALKRVEYLLLLVGVILLLYLVWRSRKRRLETLPEEDLPE